MKKEMTLDNIFRKLRGESTGLYYQPSTNTIGGPETFYKSKGKRLTKKDYEEIGNSLIYIRGLKHEVHKEIMSGFVHSCVEDKEQRRNLFNSLIHHTDFYNRFEEVCKNYGIYEDYLDFSEDIYIDIASDWYKEYVRKDKV